LEDARGAGVGPALDLLEFLDAGGHATEGEAEVGLAGRFTGPFWVDVGERVDVGRLDGRQGGVELLEGRTLAGSERVDQGTRILLPWGVGHRAIFHQKLSGCSLSGRSNERSIARAGIV